MSTKVLVVVAGAVTVGCLLLRNKKPRRNRKSQGKPIPQIHQSMYEVIKGFASSYFPQFLYYLSRSNPSVAFLPLPLAQDVILCSDPIAAKVVFEKCGKSTLYSAIDPFLHGPNLFTHASAKPPQRKEILKGFDLRAVERFREVSEDLFKKWIEEMKRGTEEQREFEPTPNLLSLILKTICKGGFDYDIPDEDGAQLLELFALISVEAKLQLYSPLRKLAASLGLISNHRRALEMATQAYKIVERMIAHYRAQGNEDSAPLMAAIDRCPVYTSDEERKRDIAVLLVAGHDTTAFQIAWCLNDLASHPEVQSELRQQILSCTPAGAAQEGQWGRDSPLLNFVVKESQRVHSVAVCLFREAKEGPVHLPSGQVIEKGSLIAIDLFSAMRNETYYPNADEWRPERWSGTAEETATANAAFIPFSTGARSCVGLTVALVQMRVFLGMLVRNFEIERTANPVLAHCITLEPHGLRIRLKPVFTEDTHTQATS